MRKITIILLMLALIFALTGTGLLAEQKKRVTIAVPWVGTDAKNFQMVKEEFMAEHPDIEVELLSIPPRDFHSWLVSMIAAKKTPDIAILSLKLMKKIAVAKKGDLKPLNFIKRKEFEKIYGPEWTNLGSVDGNLIGIFVRARNKSTIWYRPEVLSFFGGYIPSCWSELLDVAASLRDQGIAPIALAANAKSGWTLIDWLENIFLSLNGPDLYDDWANLRLDWTSDEVREAFETFGLLLEDDYLAGGRRGALSTDLPSAVDLLRGDPSQAAAVFLFEGDFMNRLIADRTGLEPGVGYKVFPFPDAVFSKTHIGTEGNIVGGGDVAVMFNDTTETKKFMRFLTTKKAAEVLVRGIETESGRRVGFISPNRLVDLALYPDENSRAVAEQLVNARVLVGFTSYYMPEEMRGALEIGLQSLVSDPSDGNLDGILQSLNKVATKLTGTKGTKPKKPESKINPVVKGTAFEATKDKGSSTVKKNDTNQITIKFDPRKSKKVTPCDKIVLIQVVQILVDGKEVKPGELVKKWKYRDNDTTNKKKFVDHLKGEKDPYYNGNDPADKGDGNKQGKCNGIKKKSELGDTPYIPDDWFKKEGNDKTTGTDYNAKKIVFKFETVAFCVSGKDKGSYFECITWEYTRTKDDAKNGRPGTSKKTGVNKSPTSELKKVVELWDKTHPKFDLPKKPKEKKKEKPTEEVDKPQLGN